MLKFTRKIVGRSCILAPALLAGFTAAASAEDGLVRSFKVGAGPDAVGYVDASFDPSMPRDRGESEGPQAIYSGDNGEVYLLDQVNRRVLQFNPKASGERARSLQLPEGAHPSDLVVMHENIYVWDGEPQALRASAAGDGVTRSLSYTQAPPSDEAVLSAFAQMGSEQLSRDDTADEIARSIGAKPGVRPRQVVASHGKGRVMAEFAAKGDAGVSINLQSENKSPIGKLMLRVPNRLGSVELLDVDRSGRIYLLAENIPNDANGDVYAFVARFGPNGALEGAYQLPFDPSVALSRRFVTISTDGDVYFLRTRHSAVDLLNVGFRPFRKGDVVDLSPPHPKSPDYSPPAPGGSTGGPSFANVNLGANAALRVLDRRHVIDTALQFANARWRVNPGAYGPDPDRSCSGFNRIRRPGYLHGKLNSDVVGIPYCWGCHGSLAKIAGAISSGRLAGNVCTRDNPRPDVIGVDCSAFVSATWGLSTHFTTIAIPAIARQLQNPWDLLPGDALNKPGSHVMLFVKFTPDKRAEVIESSTGGCNGKVCRNVYPLASLLARGYRPVRFRGLVNEANAQAVYR
ncbi:hypothetical protein [Methylocystis heyeri]|uniref:Uncharacterized protein n=1 Tax=Methylocystis heyeri TaxID=391905 RepID=A0A6B8KIF0_9HYPH|nr:hypothetical protein [Methylocystis heyeri]QGM47269.1 hypothetical protein H2LOC_017120 [Methylocystis heyeri]